MIDEIIVLACADGNDLVDDIMSLIISFDFRINFFGDFLKDCVIFLCYCDHSLICVVLCCVEYYRAVTTTTRAAQSKAPNATAAA
jgi:hypothetical protein